MRVKDLQIFKDTTAKRYLAWLDFDRKSIFGKI